MSSTLKRYEAAVKLNTGEVVTYHNINTGLYKFHQFLCSKYSSDQIWVVYRVRRKLTKEIIGTYRNTLSEKKINVIEIETKSISNQKNSGVFIPIPFVRNGFEIIRNIFLAESKIINLTEGKVVIPEWLFNKAIEIAQEELYQYYLLKDHQLSKSELILGDLKISKKSIMQSGREQDIPNLNYP